MRKKYLMIGLVGLIGITTQAYAGWPIFQVLTPERISSLAVSTRCPEGEVRIPLGTKVRIQSRNIPSNETWTWDYQGNGECFSKTKSLEYLTLEQNGIEYPSVITAFYGFSGVPVFQFVFHIPPLPWDCGYFAKEVPPIYIGCAQDQMTDDR